MALSTAAGYVQAAAAFGRGGLLVFVGTFFLTGAVSILNQIQERDRDRLMQRTCRRPLATGRMGVGQALVWTACGLFLGTACLVPLLGWGSLMVTLVVTGLYNGVYTPLKPRTSWAMLPGALCGALPPVVGWVAGGGQLPTVTPVYLFTLYVVWQMPHFWMLAEANAADYAVAGFVVPATSFSPVARRFIPRLWALALIVVAALAPLLGVIDPPWLTVALGCALFACGTGLVFGESRLLRRLADMLAATVMLLAVAAIFMR